MSDYGIVQFIAHYYPKGYNILKDVNIDPKEIKTKKDLIDDLEFSDIADMHFDGADNIYHRWKKLDMAIAKNGNVKKAFITFRPDRFVGFSMNDEYTSGVEYAFDTDSTTEMEYFVESAFEEFLEIFRHHPVLHKKRNKESTKLEDCKEVLEIAVPTLWSFSSWYDSYNNEYDYEVIYEGILDMTKLINCIEKKNNATANTPNL